MILFSNGSFSGKKTVVRKAPLEALVAPKLCRKHRQGSLSTKTLLRTVKLSALFIFFACLQVSARIEAQRVSISLKDSPLETLFKEIEHHTNYVFFYDVALVRDARVTVQAKDATVDDVLAQALRGMSLSYAIHDRTIFIKNEAARPAPVITASPAIGPSAVSGVVRDQDGKPLVGATVSIPKLKKSGVTDIKGQFFLKDVPNGEYQVEISFVGYETLVTTVTVVDHEATITADLKRTDNSLDAPVVIPYGLTTKRLNTGNVTTITAKEIGDQPVSNPLAALEGRVPGLMITQTTGAPGGGFTIQLRGQNSIFNGNQPFFVVDGVPYNSQLPTLPNSTTALLNTVLRGGSPLNFLNPSDIESIEILKDADATAIYGSRAANGAILITTKKGKAGRSQINVNVRSGYQEPAHYIPLANTPQYLGLRREAFKNDGVTPTVSNAPDLLAWDTTRYTNWQKALVNKPAYYTDAQASISGGNSNVQYLLGTDYSVQNTSMPTLLHDDGKDKKTSVHFNLNALSNDRRLKISFTGNYISDKNTVQSQDLSSFLFLLPPDAPALRNTDGSLNWAPLTPGTAGTWANPYRFLYTKYGQNTINLIGNSTISYSLLPNWELKSSFGYTLTNTDELQTFPTIYNDPGFHITTGNANFNIVKSNSWIIEPQTSYKLQFSKGTIGILFGGTFSGTNSANQKIAATGFVSDALLANPQAASSAPITSTSAQYKYVAAFGRVNFNWADKYLLNFTGRRDGSSRFGPGRQFGNFGAIGAAWVFSRENFISDNIRFLSFGKLRGSYGSTGNDGIADYQYFYLYNIQSSSSAYGGIQGLVPSNLSNPDLAWEINKKLEGGIELGVLKDRIIMTWSYYRNRSNNQLISTPTSFVTGFAFISSNLPALVQNVGQEITLNSINIKAKNFSWSSSVNLTISRNKLLAFPNLATSAFSSTYKIGEPLSNLYLYHLERVNDTTGVYQFTTNKGDLTYSPNSLTDKITSVNIAPKFFGGWQNSFQYKNISLDIMIQFVKQTGKNIFGSSPALVGAKSNLPTAFLDRWQKPGDKATYQRASQNYGSTAGIASSAALQSDFAYSDASFIRLKNVAVSYQIPTLIQKKLHLESGKIYLLAQNLVTITPYHGVDPESQGTGLPPMRTLVAGIQLTL